MMVIRQEQMDAFNYVNDIEFVERLREMLRNDYPEEGNEYDDEELNELIRQGLHRARRIYGMRWETALGDFCGLRLQLGERFDEEPRINGFLTDEFVPPNERIDRMFIELSQNDWNEIYRSLDKIEGNDK
jgi:hypothetical protein